MTRRLSASSSTTMIGLLAARSPPSGTRRRSTAPSSSTAREPQQHSPGDLLLGVVEPAMYARSPKRATAPRTPPDSRYAAWRSRAPSRPCQSSSSAVEAMAARPARRATSSPARRSAPARRPARPFGGTLDRAADLVVRPSPRRAPGSRPAAARSGYSGSARSSPPGSPVRRARLARPACAQRGGDERHTLIRVVAEREDLLELVHRDHDRGRCFAASITGAQLGASDGHPGGSATCGQPLAARQHAGASAGHRPARSTEDLPRRTAR